MKLQAFLLISSLLAFTSIHAQQNSVELYDNQIYFKIEGESSVSFNDYDASNPTNMGQIDHLMAKYDVLIVKKPYESFNTPFFDRVYWILMDNGSDERCDSIMDDLDSFAFIEYTKRITNYKPASIPNDSLYGEMWMVDAVDLLEAQDISDGDGVTIAVIDDAFDIFHPDLINQIAINTGEIPNDSIDNDNNGYIDDYYGWNLADSNHHVEMPNNYNTYTVGNHGTMVAGIACAEKGNGKGGFGTGYKAKLIPIKAKSDARINFNLAYNVPTFFGFSYAYARNADVINMSWGGPGTYNVIEDSIIQFMATQNTIMVAASGNTANLYSDTLDFYPAAYNNVISVAATTRTHEKASYSNFPSHTTVDIFAPGANLTTTYTDPNNIYFGGLGTSAASPVVAGICALMRKKHPTYTINQIRNCLVNGAVNITNQNREFANNELFSLVNAENAVNCTTNRKVIPFLLQMDKYHYCLTDTINIGVRSINNVRYSFYDNLTQRWTSQSTDTSYRILNPDLKDLKIDVKVRVYDAVADTLIDERVVEKIAVFDACKVEKLSQSNWVFGNDAYLKFTDSGINVGINRGHELYGYSNTVSNFNGNEIFTLGLEKTGYSRTEFTNFDENGSTFFSQFSKKDDDGNSFAPEFWPFKSSLAVIPDYYNDSIYYAILGNQSNDPLGSSITGTEMEFFRFNVVSGVSYPFIVPNASGYKPGPNNSMLTGYGYKLIPHVNGKDFWLICTAENRDYVANKGKILVFLVERLNTWPGLSITLHSDFRYEDFSDYRPIKGYDPTAIIASHNGNKIVLYQSERIDISGSQAKFVNDDSLVQVLNFDDSTGTLSHFTYLRGFIYSGALAFSPKDSFIYGFRLHDGINPVLCQWDAQEKNSFGLPVADVNSSSSFVDGFTYGPDGHLYINYDNQPYISIITNPENRVIQKNDNNPGYYRRAVNIQTETSSGTVNNQIHSNYGLPKYYCDPDEVDLDFVVSVIDCDSLLLTSSIKSEIPVHWDVDGSSYTGKSLRIYAPVLKAYDITMTVRNRDINKIYDRTTELVLVTEFNSCDTLTTYITDSAACNLPNIWYLNGIVIGTDIYGINLPLAGYTTPGTLEVHLRGSVLSTNVTPQPQNPIINDGVAKVFLNALGIAKLYNTNTRFSSYTAFNWLRNGKLESSLPTTDTFFATKPGRYIIYANTPCGDITSLPVDVCYDCDNGVYDTTYAALDYTFATGTTTNLSAATTWRLNGEVTVDSGATLNIYGDVVFSPCSRLHIKRGGNLYADGALIDACGIWQGILVEGNPTVSGSRFFMQNVHGTAHIRNSTISHAIVALRTENGGFAMMANDTFINNFSNVWFRNYDYDDFSSVDGSYFGNNKGVDQAAIDSSGCLDSALLENQWHYHAAPHILTKNVRMNNFTNNHLEDDLYLLPGPPKDNISYVIGDDCKGQKFDGNTIVSTHNQWVFHLNYADSVTISGNDLSYNSNYYGGEPARHAIYMKQCVGGNIEDNTINNAFTGVEYYYDSTSYTDSLKVYGNEFADVTYGIFAATTEFAINNDINTNTYTNVIPIKTECNEFDGSDIGIAGCGNWLPQGGRWISGVPRSVGNKFYNCTDAHAVLQNSLLINYIISHEEFQKYEKYAKPPTLRGDVTINGNNIIDVWSINNKFNEVLELAPNETYYLNPNCPDQSPNAGLQKEKRSDYSEIVIFPNPTFGIFNIETKSNEIFEFSLYDQQGRLIIHKNEFHTASQFGENLSPGVYYLNIYNSKMNITRKIIKLN